jgi:hypothetical protein
MTKLLCVFTMLSPFLNSLPVRVTASLDETIAPATPDEIELAGEVQATLNELQPQNPNRNRTFYCNYVSGMNGEDRGTVTRKGWNIMIRRVTPLVDGWRADVFVLLDLAPIENGSVSITECHRETYRCRNGRVFMERDSTYPWKPPGDRPRSWGMLGNVRHN